MQASHPLRPVTGFAAGALSVLVFHQLTLAVLHAAGVAPFAPYSLDPVPPLGVPGFVSAAFWGGVWGIVFALVDGRFPPARYWLTAFAFGAILPSLVALFVVVPLKGGPVGAGFDPMIWITALIINGAWGLGTGLGLRILPGGGGSTY